jgi:hypothetical protein
MLQVENQGVLYKPADRPLLIPLPLLLTVAQGDIGMTLPVILLKSGCASRHAAWWENHFLLSMFGRNSAPPAPLIWTTPRRLFGGADALVPPLRREAR